MNFLKPELIWVDDRCYRFMGGSNWSNNCSISPYIEDDSQLDYEEQTNVDIEIVPHGGTKFKHVFHVAKSFFPFIIGSRNTVRKRLETETKTVIQIPNIDQEGDIVIIASEPKGIIAARRRINLLVEMSRRRIRPTHFLSIPLNDEQIIKQFNIFKNDVLTNLAEMSKGVDEKIFQVPSKLHLTIQILTLLDEAEKNQAIEALNYCEKHIVRPIIEKYGHIPIRLKGIDIMNDDPTETYVLYAKVSDCNNVLQKLVDDIANHCAATRTFGKVKLHVTLMNSKFLLKNKEVNDVIKKPFDATEILKVHKDVFLGETVLKEIHISQRSTTSSNGYYEATAKINLLDE